MNWRLPIYLLTSLLAICAVSAEEITATVEGSGAPRLDVTFCVDATGSMGDEIDVVKEKMREMVAEISAGDPTPDVRFGLVIYRDRGDEFVTKRYALTRDIDAVVKSISEISADGGGDYPESLNEALHVTIHEIEWDTAPDVGRVIFLIADAPPHMDYDGDYNYEEEASLALEQGIVIDTIGCSGLQESDQRIFREIASITEGEFELLTYAQEFVNAEGEKEVVVHAGTALYSVEATADADWREGATRLEGRGMVAKAGEATSFGAGMGGGMMAGSPGRPTAPLQNNLDRLLTRQVQVQLARQGVRFDDQPYLASREWRGGSCEIEKRSVMTARTRDEWQEIWRLVSDGEGKLIAPEIDFTRDMVLAAFGGEAWAGRSVRIADVWEEDESLHARVERGADAADANSPYHIIVVSKHDGDVTWK